jgi:Uma2 family endonuclease
MATQDWITSAVPTAITAPTGGRIPPLESGDCLTRAEFERRYAAMPRLKKAELIRGVVYVQAAVSSFHADPHGQLVGWMTVYRAFTPGVVSLDNTTVRLSDDSEPQPDASLRIDHARGGQSAIDKDGYIEGAPELAAEVAASSASYDMHAKLDLYREQGVREYIVWRVYDNELDWFVLRDGKYESLSAGADGILRSEVFPGLWLDKTSLLSGDLAAVLRIVQAGTSSPEHAAFVERLREVRDAK